MNEGLVHLSQDVMFDPAERDLPSRDGCDLEIPDRRAERSEFFDAVDRIVPDDQIDRQDVVRVDPEGEFSVA